MKLVRSAACLQPQGFPERSPPEEPLGGVSHQEEMSVPGIQYPLDDLDPQRGKELGFIHKNDIIWLNLQLPRFHELPDALRHITPIQRLVCFERCLVSENSIIHALALFS